MSAARSRLQSGPHVAVLVLIALILGWRVVAAGVDAIHVSIVSAQQTAPEANGSVDDSSNDWRLRLAHDPTDYGALLNLALLLEREGKRSQARDAATIAMRMAPTDPGVLFESGKLLIRLGDEDAGMAVLRRHIELYADDGGKVFPIFSAALESGRHEAFFRRAALQAAPWWSDFFAHACQNSNLAGIQRLFADRLRAQPPTAFESRCIIARLQQEKHWANAYQAWLNSLPAAQRMRIGYVFNGDFELPLSNLGFDWIAPGNDAQVSTEMSEGVSGRRALHVRFVNKRYTQSPVYQYLMLFPGKYFLEGRGRPDDLNTWLGLQWGLYCSNQNGQDGPQLAHSDALAGSADWSEFHKDFVVSRDCPLQVLRLELANPRKDATTGGTVAVRLRGSVWYDDIRVRQID